MANGGPAFKYPRGAVEAAGGARTKTALQALLKESEERMVRLFARLQGTKTPELAAKAARELLREVQNLAAIQHLAGKPAAVLKSVANTEEALATAFRDPEFVRELNNRCVVILSAVTEKTGNQTLWARVLNETYFDFLKQSFRAEATDAGLAATGARYNAALDALKKAIETGKLNVEGLSPEYAELVTKYASSSDEQALVAFRGIIRTSAEAERKGVPLSEITAYAAEAADYTKSLAEAVKSPAATTSKRNKYILLGLGLAALLAAYTQRDELASLMNSFKPSAVGTLKATPTPTIFEEYNAQLKAAEFRQRVEAVQDKLDVARRTLDFKKADAVEYDWANADGEWHDLNGRAGKLFNETLRFPPMFSGTPEERARQAREATQDLDRRVRALEEDTDTLLLTIDGLPMKAKPEARGEEGGAIATERTSTSARAVARRAPAVDAGALRGNLREGLAELAKAEGELGRKKAAGADAGEAGRLKGDIDEERRQIIIVLGKGDGELKKNPGEVGRHVGEDGKGGEVGRIRGEVDALTVPERVAPPPAAPLAHFNVVRIEDMTIRDRAIFLDDLKKRYDAANRDYNSRPYKFKKSDLGTSIKSRFDKSAGDMTRLYDLSKDDSRKSQLSNSDEISRIGMLKTTVESIEADLSGPEGKTTGTEGVRGRIDAIVKSFAGGSTGAQYTHCINHCLKALPEAALKEIERDLLTIRATGVPILSDDGTQIVKTCSITDPQCLGALANYLVYRREMQDQYGIPAVEMVKTLRAQHVTPPKWMLEAAGEKAE